MVHYEKNWCILIFWEGYNLRTGTRNPKQEPTFFPASRMSETFKIEHLLFVQYRRLPYFHVVFTEVFLFSCHLATR